MNFKTISDSDLLERTRHAVHQEREATSAVLHHLEEIEARKLYLERGYPSLFEICVKLFGYSAGAAHRRIASMRCLKSLGDHREAIEEKLEQGTLTLMHLSQVESLARTERMTIATKAELIESVEGTSTRECEKKLAALQSSQPAPHRTVVKALPQNQARMSLTLDAETMELLEKFQTLTSHQNPKKDPAKSLKLALQMALNKIDPERNVRQRKTQAPSLPALEVKSKTTIRARHIPHSIKRAVWKRDQGHCSYTDSKTGRRCSSQQLVQYDHIKPYSHGGEHTTQNLRLLCFAHHQNETKRMGL